MADGSKGNARAKPKPPLIVTTRPLNTARRVPSRWTPHDPEFWLNKLWWAIDDAQEERLPDSILSQLRACSGAMLRTAKARSARRVFWARFFGLFAGSVVGGVITWLLAIAALLSGGPQ